MGGAFTVTAPPAGRFLMFLLKWRERKQQAALAEQRTFSPLSGFSPQRTDEMAVVAKATKPTSIILPKDISLFFGQQRE